MSVTLSALRNGGLEEQFQIALRAALENARDPNTPHDKKRRITIHVDLKPSEDRQVFGLMYHVESKLAGIKPGSSFLLLDGDEPVEQLPRGKADPRQMGIVTPLPTKEK